MAVKIQLRRDSAADWTSNNPTLTEGEVGYETDTGKFKIGDGSTAWASLDWADSGHTAAILAAMREPTGFADRTLSTLSLATRTVTCAPTATSFDIYSGGVRYTKTSVNTTIADTVGMHYIYFDTTGALTNGTVAWNIESANVPVATVYWNGTAGILGDERHGIQMDGMTQEYLHETNGSAFVSGMGGTFASNGQTHTITAGEWYDDDFEHAPAQQTTSRLFYRDATGSLHWTWDAPSAYLYKTSGTAPYYDAAGTLTEVAAAKFSHSWVFATNEAAAPTAVVMGQATYNTKALAEAAGPETLALGTLPVAEMLLLYRVTWHRDGSNNAIVWDSTTDYRRSPRGQVSNYVATDHSSLSNLAYATSGHTGFVASADVGTIAAQNSNNVTITGGSISGITDLAVADGGTGASTLVGAGIPQVVATYSATGQTGNIAKRTALASAPTGIYRCTVAVLFASNNANDVLVPLVYPYAGAEYGVPFLCSGGLNTIDQSIVDPGGCAVAIFHHTGSNNISWQMTKSGGDDYDVYFQLERLA